MFEFIKQYWQFVVAGIILLALIIYWVVEAILAKKKKQRELDELEKSLEEAEKSQTEPAEVKEEEKEEVKAEETAQEKPVEAKPAKKRKQKEAEQVEEVKEEPAEEVKEEPAEEEKEERELGHYTISYDKEKKDWVIKRPGSQRATKRTKTKKEALEIVKKLTETQEVGFVVKKKNGKFQKK